MQAKGGGLKKSIKFKKEENTFFDFLIANRSFGNKCTSVPTCTGTECWPGHESHDMHSLISGIVSKQFNKVADTLKRLSWGPGKFQVDNFRLRAIGRPGKEPRSRSEE